jgi:hypothetical protein
VDLGPQRHLAAVVLGQRREAHRHLGVSVREQLAQRARGGLGVGPAQRLRGSLGSGRDEVRRRVGGGIVTGVHLELGGVQLVAHHRAPRVRRGAVLDQPGRVHHALAQHAQQRGEVGLAAVLEERLARGRVHEARVGHHVPALEHDQRVHQVPVEHAIGEALGEQPVAAQVLHQLTHGVHRDALVLVAAVVGAVALVGHQLVDGGEAQPLARLLEPVALPLHATHAGLLLATVAPRAQQLVQHPEVRVAHARAARMALGLEEPLVHHAQGGKDAEELEEALRLHVLGQRLEVLVGEGQQGRAVGLHPHRAERRVLREHTRRPLGPQIEHRQPLGRRVVRADRGHGRTVGVDRESRRSTARGRTGARGSPGIPARVRSLPVVARWLRGAVLPRAARGRSAAPFPAAGQGPH